MRPARARRRRLARGQHRARRALERSLRIDVLALARWCRSHGRSRAAAASALGISSAVLGAWQRRWTEDRLELRDRGRPETLLDQSQRKLVLGLLHLLGADLGVATLARMVPDAPRSALEDLVERYRDVYRRRAMRHAISLRWTRAGAVWAIDFTAPPLPVDGAYPHLLVVRDLASGQQLAALPTATADADQVVGLLEALVRQHGAPLVLKSDNGSALTAGEVTARLRTWGTVALVSPPATPRYNGACEAGIGGLKTRAHHESVRCGRPGEWTCDDVERARLMANEAARPWGRAEPTPDQAWSERTPIDHHEQRALAAAIEQHRQEVTKESNDEPPNSATIERIAITQALLALGYLKLRRRRFSPPISSRRVVKIN